MKKSKPENWFHKHPAISSILILFAVLLFVAIFVPSQQLDQTDQKIQVTVPVEEPIPTKSTAKLGYLVVSGEEAGTCYVKDINMWSESKSAADGAYVVGKISNACPQKTVPYYDLVSSTSRIWYLVESGGRKGWITDTFVIDIK